jgi:Raf kinase inhibitor-like YbhB/YbcL family protein
VRLLILFTSEWTFLYNGRLRLPSTFIGAVSSCSGIILSAFQQPTLYNMSIHITVFSCITLFFSTATAQTQTPLIVKSAAFAHNGSIPSKYTCEGANINPPLTISDIPGDARTIAIIMDDPDAGKGTFDHWVIWNIDPAAAASIREFTAPGMQGKNGKDQLGYTGPCPPSRRHHYHFKVYALDTELNLQDGAGKKELEKALEGHILTKGALIGTYKKKN